MLKLNIDDSHEMHASCTLRACQIPGARLLDLRIAQGQGYEAPRDVPGGPPVSWCYYKFGWLKLDALASRSPAISASHILIILCFRTHLLRTISEGGEEGGDYDRKRVSRPSFHTTLFRYLPNSRQFPGILRFPSSACQLAPKGEPRVQSRQPFCLREQFVPSRSSLHFQGTSDIVHSQHDLITIKA